MKTIELSLNFLPIRLIDWRIPEEIEPNLELLAELQKVKVRQSATSQSRQQFISGVSVYGFTKAEKTAKASYLAEWHERISQNI